MLPPREKALAKELLGGLDQEELFQLAKTSTNGNLNPKSKEDAIEIITSYEEDARSLLNRRKITKVLLFNYLHWKKDPPSANADKTALVDYVLRLWQIVEPSNARCSGIEESRCSTGEIPNSYSVVKCTAEPQNQPDVVNAQGNEVNRMGLKFSEWFYNLINEDFTNKGGPLLKEDDFWKESIVSVTITHGSNSETVQASTNTEAVSILRGVVREHRLFFSPNLTSQGVRGKLEPHGIVLIVACGTLHQGAGECVGIFEQLFSLIKDPLRSDNWKIKRTDMKLRTKTDVRVPPSLDDIDLGSLVPLNQPD